MKPLPFVLFAIGVTLSRVVSSSMPQAKPVPKPEDARKGYWIIQFTLDTNIKLEDCFQNYSECMRFFDDTKIMEYSESLGDLSAPMLDMNIESGRMVYSFAIENADCGAVKQWTDQIVHNSSLFTSANVTCPESPTSMELPVPKVQPVPKPEDARRGSLILQFTLDTNIKLEDCFQNYSECMRFFDDTKIMEYSESLGDLSAPMLDMNIESGLMVYSFAIENADCEAVKHWTDQIVHSSPIFISANVKCPESPTLMA